MTIAVKRILLVTRDVQFAINVKRALETLGEYAVTPVTEARNAIEQLRRKAHHLALLDIENLAIAPAVMIDLIRARQGEIAIVLAPDNPSTRKLAQEYRVQGLVDIPVSTRFLIPILEKSLRDVYEALPQTAKLPAIEMQEDTVNIESLVDGLPFDKALPSYTLQKLQASYRLLHPPQPDDEAAAPTATELSIEADDESGAIRYQPVHVLDQADSTSGIPDEDTPLSSVDEQSTARDLGLALSNPALGASEYATTAPMAQGLDADSLGRMLRELGDENKSIYNIAAAEPHHVFGGRAIANLGRARHHYGGEDARGAGRPPENLPTLEGLPNLDQTTVPAIAKRRDEIAASPAATAYETDASGFMPAPLFGKVDDPYLRQVATVMTQTMTELTAEATLLTRDNAVLAYSGALQMDALKALRKAIKDDWTAPQDRARLRFVTLRDLSALSALPDDGGHFMLYSKGTLDDLTLSLVFAGSQSISAINRQGDRILKAMAQVPAGAAATAEDAAVSQRARSDMADTSPRAATDKAIGSTQALTFVWLVADSTTALSQGVAKQLVFWLEVQLNNLGWIVRRIDVHQDFVYLVANIPKGAAPGQSAKDLMARSARIARAEDPTLPQALWADAYLVLQPGRDLNMRELGGFLRFARAED